MSRQGRIAIGLWLLFVVACIWQVGRATFTADLSAFLPRTPTQEQQLLVDQLKSGIASRLILVGIEGGEGSSRAQASRALAARLRGDAQFLHVANGESVGLERDRQILFDNRYLLSPAVVPGHFSTEGLNAAVGDSIEQLASSTGLLSKALLTRDPTGDFMRVLDQMGGDSQPAMAQGVWVSRDGRRALLLVRTRAEGSDTDKQEKAVAAIRDAFKTGAAAGLTLSMTGPGPFSVAARATIQGEVTKLSGLSSLIIIVLLLLVYRSAVAVVIGILPVLTSALAGIAAVSLGFGTVHGVTLGFGTALIGEAVDYSIYLMMQSEQGRQAGGRERWVAAFWPTIRIGVLTSVFGFAPLLFSGFPGLSQLGLYSIAGLFTAAAVTRFVLPHLLPSSLSMRDMTTFGSRLAGWQGALNQLRWPLFALFAAACLATAVQRDHMWNRELSALSPVPAADQAVDMSMRADLGAPDVRYLVVVAGATAEAALAASERVGQGLQGLVATGDLGGFKSPAVFLPSLATQRARLASLPAEAELRRNFQAAASGLPIRADRFDPFFADVAAARSRAPLQRADIEGSSLAEGVDSLLVKMPTRWTALLPLQAPGQAGGAIDAAKVRASLAATGLSEVYFVDLKTESDHLYEGYLREAILLSLAGLAAIVALLFATTRSLVRVLRIVAPLAIAAAVVIAGLVLSGQQLTILHLVGLLLIFAMGSNYALFFDKSTLEGGIAPQTLASLLVATTTTVAGFGLLGFSSVPVLNAIGATVGPGAVLALLFSAILARKA